MELSFKQIDTDIDFRYDTKELKSINNEIKDIIRLNDGRSQLIYDKGYTDDQGNETKRKVYVVSYLARRLFFTTLIKNGKEQEKIIYPEELFSFRLGRDEIINDGIYDQSEVNFEELMLGLAKIKSYDNIILKTCYRFFNKHIDQFLDSFLIL